jgi:hypothetical protein
MRKQSWTALLAATALTMTAGKVHAATYAESGDAGETLSDAAIVGSQAFGEPLDAITGTLTANDADLFLIYISNPATFSANTFFSTPGVNNFNTELLLFDADGSGLYANDDAPPPANGSQSALPAGTLSAQTAGLYYIAVSGAGYAPVNANGGLIFPTTPFDAILAPTGVGAARILSGWTGNSGSNTGAYQINLKGATFVPEPTVSVLLPSMIALWGAASLKRRSRSKA